MTSVRTKSSNKQYSLDAFISIFKFNPQDSFLEENEITYFELEKIIEERGNYGYDKIYTEINPHGMEMIKYSYEDLNPQNPFIVSLPSLHYSFSGTTFNREMVDSDYVPLIKEFPDPYNVELKLKYQNRGSFQTEFFHYYKYEDQPIQVFILLENRMNQEGFDLEIIFLNEKTKLQIQPPLEEFLKQNLAQLSGPYLIKDMLEVMKETFHSQFRFAKTKSARKIKN